MSSVGMIKAVLKEYGLEWAINRSLYSAKLKMMKVVAPTERFFEKNTSYPKKIDLFRIDVKTLNSFIHGLGNDDRIKLIETADKACKGIIKGFSSIELNYGYPIDWQLNPLTGKRCDEGKMWYRIPDFDKERGDIKVVWEASRFSHFITLARAFVLTKDEKYYKAFSEQLSSWLAKNPYNYGANFKCGQECSLRMVNGLLAFAIFKDCGVATDADAANLRDVIDRCYRKVLGNFFYAYKCVKNNHTISELMGMIVGAWCCEDNKQLDKAFRLLDKVIKEQFADDGGYRQFSFNYQRLALQDIECVLAIEERTGKRLSEISREKIRKAAILMFQCQDESGDMPNYGANDGALIFPVTSCGYRDFRPVINTIYALTAGKQLYRAGSHQEELIWFSGGKELEQYEYRQMERSSMQFPAAGIFTIRSKEAWAMVVANEYKTRPAHMDQLHFDLWINGFNILCDGGTYSYASDIGKRLVRNESHNTAVVEGRVQMNVSGPFLIYGWTRRLLGKCDGNSFEGIIHSQNGYTHERTIRVTDTSYEIIDKVDADCSIVFHTPCKAEIKNGEIVLSVKGKVLSRMKSNAEMSLQKAARSLYYLKEEETNCIVLRHNVGDRYITTIEIENGEIEK